MTRLEAMDVLCMRVLDRKNAEPAVDAAKVFGWKAEAIGRMVDLFDTSGVDPFGHQFTHEPSAHAATCRHCGLTVEYSVVATWLPLPLDPTCPARDATKQRIEREFAVYIAFFGPIVGQLP